jgi:hypothetical protein
MPFRLLNPVSMVVRLSHSLTIVFLTCVLGLTAHGQSVFRLPVTNQWRTEIIGVCAADVNSDGWTDVITSGTLPLASYVFTNDHQEGFQSFYSLPWSETHPVGDFDADGHADFLTQSGGVVTNGGIASFGTYRAFEHQTIFISADINDDGLNDIAALDKVYTNAGNGTFSESCNFGHWFYSIESSIIAADLNSDGKSDLLFAGSPSLIVLTNVGKGCFALSQSNFFWSPGHACTVDLRGDGKPCIVVPNYRDGFGTSLVFFTNDASGVFNTNMVLAVGQGPRVVISGDLNGDGAEDLLCQFYHGGILVLTNDLDGSFGSNSMIGAYGPMALADLNSDGKLDLLTAEPYYAATNLLIYYNAFPFPPPASQPPLSLKTSGKGMDLSWPADSKGWSLRCTRDLASPEWLPAGVDGYQIETKGTNKTLHVQPSPAPRFYRLMHPAAE